MGEACPKCKGTGTIWRGYPPRVTCWFCGGRGAPDPNNPPGEYWRRRSAQERENRDRV